MITIDKTNKKTLSLLLCSLLLLPTLCIAGTYQITEQELTQLETTLTQQQSTIKTLLNTLETLKLDSSEAKEQLIQAKNELITLSQELETLKQEVFLLKINLKNSTEALSKANQSLVEYEKEVKRKINNLKVKKNIAYVLAISAFAYAVSK